MLENWRTHWLILSISIRERLTYRGDFAFATLVRFLPLITQIFLWAAIFGVAGKPDRSPSADPSTSPDRSVATAVTDASRAATDRSQAENTAPRIEAKNEAPATQRSVTTSEASTSQHTPPRKVSGYSYTQMIAYYLLANIARAFSSMPGLANSLAKEVRDGSIKRFLTQPVDLLTYYFWGRVAHKLVYYLVAAAPFALVFYLCRDFFTGQPTIYDWGAFFVALLFAFLIGFLIESLIGLVSFWFLEIGSVVFIFMMLNYFLSGHMLPLDFLTSQLPRPVTQVLLLLPFQYLAYFPATILLGRYQPDELLRHLAISGSWVVLLWLLNRLALRRGIRRYSAFGG